MTSTSVLLRARVFLIALFGSVVVLAGCGSGGEPQGGQSSSPPSSSAAVTATPSPAPTAVYKRADAKGKAENVPIPVMPEAAKADTKEGAEAFTVYWFRLMSFAYETGDIGPLSNITGANCEMCEGVKSAVPKAFANDRWVSGGIFSTPSVSSTFKPQPDQRIPVIVQVIQSRIQYWSPGGTEYRKPTEETNTGNVAFLRFVENGWILENVNPLR